MNQNRIVFSQYGDAQMWGRSMRALMKSDCIQLGKGRFQAVSAVVPFRNYGYSISKCAKACYLSFKPVEGSVLICILRARDQLRTNLGVVDAGAALAFAIDDEGIFIGRLPQDTDVLVLRLARDRFAKMVQAWFGFASCSQVDRLLRRGVTVDPTMFTRCMLAVPSWNDDSPEWHDSSQAGSSNEASLLLAFLGALAPLGDGGKPIDVEVPNQSLLEKAVRLMLTNYSEKITLNELCDTCGASASTLISVFTRFWGMPPMKFLLKVRLQKAHTLLSCFTGRQITSSVTTVAAESGFWHFGRFSGYYKSQFNELPSETLWRLSTPDLNAGVLRQPQEDLLLLS